MEMHPLPSKPRTLALAIATSLMASYSLVPAYASGDNSEWRCLPAAAKSWDCAVVSKKSRGLKKNAPTPNRTGVSFGSVQATADATAYLDWVPYEQLTPQQRAMQPYYSSGAYIEPARPGLDFKGDVNSQPIIAEADSTRYDQDSLATLEGNVRLRQGSRQFEGDRVILDKDKNRARFEGHTVVREPGLLLSGDRGEAQVDTGEAVVDNAAYVLHEQAIRGQARTVVRRGDSAMDLTEATYTRSPPGTDGWLLSGRKVALNPVTGLGSARSAVIRVQGVPVLYSPYFVFPIDSRRRSGFLYPSLSSDQTNGLDMRLPYYLNLSPRYDATITPRLLSKRGGLLEAEARYLGETSRGELGLAGLTGRDKIKSENPYYDQNRWLVNWRHSIQLNPGWDVRVDYADASDKNYLNDFGTQLKLSNSSPLDQKIESRYLGGTMTVPWQLRVAAQRYKNMSQISNNPYNRLPQVAFQGRWQATERLEFDYLADYTRFSRAAQWRFVRQTLNPAFASADKVYQSLYDGGYGIARAEGERLYLATGVSYPMRWSYGFLTPQIKVRHVQYRLDNLVREEVLNDLTASYREAFARGDYSRSPATTVPAFSLDGGLYFDRPLARGTQTLEPRMKYLYAPYVQGQAMNPVFDAGVPGFSYSALWRDRRFSGYDRLGDSNQLALGITSRLIEDDGFERARVGIGQAFYFSDRRVYIDPTTGQRAPADWVYDLTLEQKKLRDKLDDPVSPVAAELVYNISRVSSLSQELVWDSNENRIDNYGIYYRYRPQNNRQVINVGYRFRDQVARYLKDENNSNIWVDPMDRRKGYRMTANDLSQSDLSFAWPLNRHWSTLGRWQYDLTNNRNLEILSGVEYNSSSYQLRLLWRSWIETDDNIDHPTPKSGVFLQFVLRGLGGLSSGSVNNYLTGIQGYTQHEK